MNDLDLSIFTAINSHRMTELFDSLLPYLYGYKAPELFFLFLVVIWAGIALSMPRRGPKISVSGFLVAVGLFLGGPLLSTVFHRPFPFLEKALESTLILRAEVLSIGDAFPVIAVLVFSGVLAPLAYYIPSFTLFILFFLGVYSLGPVYLGLAYPSDSIGSMLLGFGAGFVVMHMLKNKRFFDRHAK